MDARRTLAALNDEWRLLDAEASARVAGWAAVEPALAAAAQLTDVLTLIRRRPDEVLAALLRLGADGDNLAHRVVLQTMLGRLVRLCASRPGTLAEAVSELWLAIVEYPLDRRPRSIASNLAWTVQRRLARPAVLVSDAIDAACEPTEPDASATLGEARRLGLIDDTTHCTLWLVYVAGLTSRQASARLGISPDLVRWRCSRAVRHLARHAELLAS